MPTARTRARRNEWCLTPAEVAKQLGKAPKTLANWRCLGIGPAWRSVGEFRDPRYRQRDVDEWAARAAVTAKRARHS